MASNVQNNIPLPFISRRSAVLGQHYMVASTQPLASQAGVRILEQGGNAADAAVAVAAALGVTEPFSTGLGGDCFCLFYSARDKQVYGLNGSGRAPAALSIDRLEKEFGISGEIPERNVHGITVPGAAAGWTDTVERFGSGAVELGEILAPAIELAEAGFPVSELTAVFWRDGTKVLQRASGDVDGLVMDGGQGPQAGQVVRNPALAQTLRLLAQHGKDGFYRGPVADAIVQSVTEQGGVLTHADLQAHTSTLDSPISYEYRGRRLHECAPNGGGLAALIALGILDVLEDTGVVSLAAMEHNSAEYLHVLVEALRLAFVDTRRYVCDPDFGAVPVERLLSREHLTARARLFDPARAVVDVNDGAPVGGSDTVYFSVVDAAGNACSFVNSLYHGFGTGIVPRNYGFPLHDRGCLFSLDPAHANCLEPGKRPYHTIIPAMVTVDGELSMSYGIMGGMNQPQAHVQVLLNIARFKMNAQTALDVPRFCIQVDRDGSVAVEDGVAEPTLQGLRSRGHRVFVQSGINRALFGRGQVIRVLPDSRSARVLEAGSDPRADGQAVGR
ncbi:hypothetical protein H4S02_003315 [Coemansia sp. RSA 2611]|nr:hypothetical protein H4S02_003315 [Coemansia sp. RSA 2611]